LLFDFNHTSSTESENRTKCVVFQHPKLTSTFTTRYLVPLTNKIDNQCPIIIKLHQFHQPPKSTLNCWSKNTMYIYTQSGHESHRGGGSAAPPLQTRAP
jgi:hypothetical protein